jgi:hypothetical protein
LRSPVAALSLVVLVCSGGAAPATAAAQRSAAQRCAAAPDGGWTVVSTVGADTLAVERLTERGRVWRAEMDARKQQAMLRLTAALDADRLVSSVEVETWHPGRDRAGPPTQHSVVAFAPGLATADVRSPGTERRQQQADSVPAGTLPFMTSMTFYLDLLVRRAAAVRAAAGTAAADPVRVPVLWLFTGGHLEHAHVVRRGRDSVTITLPQAVVEARLGPDGRLAAGRERLLRFPDRPPREFRRLGCS